MKWKRALCRFLEIHAKHEFIIGFIMHSSHQHMNMHFLFILDSFECQCLQLSFTHHISFGISTETTTATVARHSTEFVQFSNVFEVLRLPDSILYIDISNEFIVVDFFVRRSIVKCHWSSVSDWRNINIKISLFSIHYKQVSENNFRTMSFTNSVQSQNQLG